MGAPACAVLTASLVLAVCVGDIEHAANHEAHTESDNLHSEARQDDAATIADCVDRNFQCTYWAGIGECDKNPNYMHVMCKPSCSLCPGDKAHAGELYRVLEERYARHAEPTLPAAEFNEISFDPLILVFDNFLTDAECEFLQEHARPHLQAAMTINQTTGVSQLDKVRTNRQMYISASECREHPIISNVVQRMHNLARVPYGHGEALQIGHYKEGQFYEPHYDSEPAQNVIRTATVIVYLQEPERGGETLFPKRAHCMGQEFHECCAHHNRKNLTESGGLWLRPKKRQAALFYSHDLTGRHNPFAMHGSCKVLAGEKWIAQQWFRSKRFPDSPHYGLHIGGSSQR